LSKIVVTASAVKWPATALLAFKRLTGVPPSGKKFAEGTPILETSLFMNDHVSVAQMLHGLIELDRAEQLDLGYYELGPEEHFSEAPLAECKITAEVLENILKS
jgi:hypothetical protein